MLNATEQSTNTRICNVNSFSSIIDRIIIENLKLLQFIDTNNVDKITQQNKIISKLKYELDIIYNEIISNKYKSCNEQRTYNTEKLFFDIFTLCLNNYCVSIGDFTKLQECEKPIVNPDVLKQIILAVRGNLESRSRIKNNLEKINETY